MKGKFLTVLTIIAILSLILSGCTNGLTVDWNKVPAPAGDPIVPNGPFIVTTTPTASAEEPAVFAAIEVRCEAKEVFINIGAPLGSVIFLNGRTVAIVDASQKWSQTTTNHKMSLSGNNQDLPSLKNNDLFSVRYGSQELATATVPDCR